MPEHQGGDGADFERLEMPVSDPEAERLYQQQVQTLRVRVMRKLGEIGALGNEEGWATFDLEETEEPDPDEENDDVERGCKDAFVLAMFDESPAPCTSELDIRIITNEPFITPHGIEVLVEDVVIDNAADAQCLVGVCNPTIDPAFETTPSPFFFAKDGHYFLSKNFQLFPPLYDITDMQEPGEDAADAIPPVLPFGHYECLADRQYALDKAVAIMDEIESLQPSDKKITL